MYTVFGKIWTRKIDQEKKKKKGKGEKMRAGLKLKAQNVFFTDACNQ